MIDTAKSVFLLVYVYILNHYQASLTVKSPL